MPTVHVLAFCAFVVGTVFAFVRKDYALGFIGIGLCLYTLP
jgi:hypothetical protein